MVKKLSEAQLKELTFKRDWCLAVIEGIGKVCPASECNFIVTEFPPIINKTFDKMDMRGMRVLYDDINDIEDALTPSQLIELNRILRERFGQDLTTANNRLGNKADSIIKRGKIRNDEEYYQMKPYVDHLLWTGVAGDEEKAKILDKLLYEYEQRVAAKMEKG
ncbi:MAG: hypothetical protein HDR88_13850 [Bacteroides sp.]|nr:hypothetical protein [Bacteroides sp.]